ncbi:MAG: LysM peptidoglycan-binding domain-containing protein [Chloroflexi bacterium]|nr:LysM peptidoglycan-binding domain-containing protein [Chloroflexota bacterium]
MMRRRYTQAIISALIIVLMLGGGLASSMPRASTPVELLKNGSFEEGFVYQDGCGMVGVNWGCFQNGGTAHYGFYDDQWDPVVYDGEHSQLIGIDTKKVGGDPDRYAGIYQTVSVVPGETYHFSIRGMIRADDQDSDPWRYRVQVGFDHTGGSDWTAVTNWIELPWDTYYPRTAPGDFSQYETNVVAQGSKLTVFVRVWKKWGDWYRELNVNLDAISLTGPVPVAMAAPPTSTPQPAPTPPPALVCTGPNLLRNGGFEQGFYGWGVGYYWGWFHNDGQASYGFHDDQWAPTVYEGEHSQLIAISTKGMAASDSDRYAGIYQVVSGLEPGVQYELSIAGMIREEELHPDEDPYRYRVQWGYLPWSDLDWTRVTNWQDLPWETVYARTAPGDFSTYKTTFVAPSPKVTLFIRVWKKWPTPGREVDVNIDAVTLRRCWAQDAQTADPASEPIVYVVQPGDVLSSIAARYGTTVQAIAQANNLSNPNLIYVGQKLIIPTMPLPTPPVVIPASPTPSPTAPPQDQTPEETVYVVRRGDTLYAIAVRYGVTPYAIAKANGLQNLHWIYPGQKLVIPNS